MKKITIEEMRNIAKGHSGKCLSDIYVNSYTNLMWECTEGHQWEAKPSNTSWKLVWKMCAYSQKSEKKATETCLLGGNHQSSRLYPICTIVLLLLLASFLLSSLSFVPIREIRVCLLSCKTPPLFYNNPQ